MSKYVVTGNTVTIDAVDVSASLARAELTMNSSEIDATDLASGGWTEVLGGLKSGSVSLDFHADFGASGISGTLNEALLGTIIVITIIANNGSVVGVTTPKFTFSALLTSITPVSGAVGDLSTFSLTLPTTGAVVRTTA